MASSPFSLFWRWWPDWSSKRKVSAPTYVKCDSMCRPNFAVNNFGIFCLTSIFHLINLKNDCIYFLQHFLHFSPTYPFSPTPLHTHTHTHSLTPVFPILHCLECVLTSHIYTPFRAAQTFLQTGPHELSHISQLCKNELHKLAFHPPTQPHPGRCPGPKKVHHSAEQNAFIYM